MSYCDEASGRTPASKRRVEQKKSRPSPLRTPRIPRRLPATIRACQALEEFPALIAFEGRAEASPGHREPSPTGVTRPQAGRRNQTVTKAAMLPKQESIATTSIPLCVASHSRAAVCASSILFRSNPTVCRPEADPSKRTNSIGGGGRGGGVVMMVQGCQRQGGGSF